MMMPVQTRSSTRLPGASSRSEECSDDSMEEEEVTEPRWVSASNFFLCFFLPFGSKSPFAIAPSKFLDRIIAKSVNGIRSLCCRITRFKGSGGGFGQRGGFELVGGRSSVGSILIHFGIGSVRSKHVLAHIRLIFVSRIRLPDLL